MTYDVAFYAGRREATRYAAERVLAVVARHVRFARVADAGCGTGTWLATALAMGASDAFGYEGSWIDNIQLDDDRIRLAQLDLEHSLAGERVDLVISLEVAEHLSVARAEGFVSDLCAMAPAILFGAAIPGQGGVNHVNEQWQSYWAHKFAVRRYAAFDVIRPLIWGESDIPAWYRQNSVLYVSDEIAPTLTASAVSDLETLDLVHPVFWKRANRELEYANAIPESLYLRGFRAD